MSLDDKDNILAFTPPAEPRQAEPPEVPPYAELLVTSNFSFLRAGSHPRELIAQAVKLGLAGMGLCDRNSFAGVVRAYTALRDLEESVQFGAAAKSFRYVVGVRLVFADGTPDIVAYPTDRAAYGRLCKLLTTGNLRAEKGECTLNFADLEAFAEGQLFILKADEKRPQASEDALATLRRLASGRVWLAADCTYGGADRMRLNGLAAMARRQRVPLLATNDVLYHAPGRRVLQDVVTCIRQHLTIATAGRRLQKNAERHLKPPVEMARLFKEHPATIDETRLFLSRIGFCLSDLRYNYPEETVGNGETAQETLERLAWQGATKRYPKGVPDRVKAGVWSELCLIAYKHYAAYFLTVHDIVRHARENLDILCQGRGSAANSMVCFCLGVTEVDPMLNSLVFGRFLSTERDEPPDIDVDFEHERREEVMQYLYTKYGRDRTGLTATVVSYRSRGAMRDVAKVFGLSSDMITTLNGLNWGSQDGKPRSQRIRDLGYDPDEPTLSKVLDVTGELMEFPRHLSQHVGGFVITRDRLDHLIPIANAAMENRTVVEWDKDDLDALGILKVDVLALGMLTCLKRAFDLMADHYGRKLTLAGIVQEERDDEERRRNGERTQSDRVYAMAQRADTIGVFQIESRAQMSMLPRLQPKEFYDLVIEVAIVRPGPIQGGMVHPYLKRRMGHEDVDYPSEKLREVLKRTLGIPLFQEQAMQIAVVGAGFTTAKADRLRRAMATWRRNGRIHELKEDFINGMLANKYTRDFAERCFSQIEGFGDYGFPESHAASFALLVYVSCWLKCHYPDVFACALLNSQPMGFYQPAQIVRDAEEHGVEIRPVDINRSAAEASLEPGRRAAEHLHPRHADMREDIRSDKALRLGFASIAGLKEAHIETIVARRGGGYRSIRDLWLRTGLAPAVLEKLAEADAFAESLDLGRRDALWAIKGLIGTDGAETLSLFAAAGPPAPRPDEQVDLPAMAPGEAVIEDYKALSLSLKGHPVQFLRQNLARRGIIAAAELAITPAGAIVEVAGLVLVRQRPGTASGLIFMTIEDETGIANIVVWNRVFDKNRLTILGSRLIAVRGEVQREGLVVHVIARSFTDFTPDLMALARGENPASSNESNRPSRRRRTIELDHEARAALPAGRNFH